jgi:translation initiation factor IF-2
VPSKVRVYELARELGLTNAETLELCEQLGIGVKSHSSSIVDAQADRVRRRAERDGLIRDEQPPEPAAAKKTTKKAAKKTTKKAAKKTAKKAAKETTKKTAKKTNEKTAKKAAKKTTEKAAVIAEADTDQVETVEPPEPAETEPAETAPTAEAPAKSSRRVISSSGSAAPPRRKDDEAVASAPADFAPRKVVKKVVKKVIKRPPGDSAPTGRPTSGSGKPIPPPPGPPRSQSGRAIPPPPGGGVRSRPGGQGRGQAPAGPSGGPGGMGAPGARPGGGPPPGGGRRSGGPRQSVPGAGARPGGPGGAPGGRGAPGRRPPRRKSRRRRSREELQPMDIPTYTPEDAPVPEGEVVVERASTAQDLGPKLNRTAADVVRFLMQQGEMVTATQSLSDDMIELFAAEVGAEVRLVDPGEEQEVELQKLLGMEGEEEPAESPTRPPVITVMGHVDHGKTKLLDQIRNANVVEGEAGGITQHIGAYQIDRDGHQITFIDTPGHEAFTAMRARGAQATDIVILVVAADDGVMPQTIEALNHAKAAEVPIVVAVNKIDRDNADPQKVLSQIAEHELVPEAWGGDTIVQEVSALENIGIEDLLDQLLLVAEVEDLRADPEGRASGVVLESNLDIGRGPVATVLVQRGTLEVGDPMVAGAAWGRVRALIDDHGDNVDKAGPSTPVQVLGLSDVAEAGDEFVVAPSEKVASRVADTREHWQRQASLGREAHALSGGAKLEDIFDQIQRGEAATLNVVAKADVNGSLEAVTESLRRLERDEVKIGFVHRGVGGITENDIQLAAASNATIIGFNVRPDRKARELAEEEHVEIRTYEIIYKLLEDIEAAMIGMLAPEFEEIVTGDAEVREIFRIPRVGAIAGCYVQNGTITRGSKVRFLRDGVIIWKGEISSLRRFKDDVRDVQAGYECGIGLSDFQDLKEGDVIETYEEREIARTLDG